MGCRLWGRIESDTTEATQQQESDTTKHTARTETPEAFPGLAFIQTAPGFCDGPWPLGKDAY